MIFDCTNKLNKIKSLISPLILISIVKLNESLKNSDPRIYKNLNLENTTNNFIKKFDFFKNGRKINYRDVKIWESQFEKGNVFAILKDNEKQTFYLMHISFLKSFHEDLLNFELSNFENPNILNHVENFVEIEKDILKRNSGRETFQFCCEFYLNCSKMIEDEKSKEIKDKCKPYMTEFYHYEFLNDFKVIKNKIYYKTNHSIFNKNHLKVYTLKNCHLLKGFENQKSNDFCYFYKNLTNNLSRIYGKTTQNYNNLKNLDPDDIVYDNNNNNKKKIKFKKRIVFSTEQLYL